jgi:hypothetical protein
MAERRSPNALDQLVEAKTVQQRTIALCSARRPHVSPAFIAATESDVSVGFDFSDSFGGSA